MKTKQMTDFQDYLKKQIKVSKSPNIDRLLELFDVLVEKYDFKKDHNFLDVGCRRGDGVMRAVNNGYENVYGCDIGQEMINKYGDSHRFKQCDMHDSKQFDFGIKFDLITIIHVLEHSYDCHKVLQNLKNALSDEGKIFIVLPFGELENEAHFFEIKRKEDFYGVLAESGLKVVDMFTSRGNTEVNYLVERR